MKTGIPILILMIFFAGNIYAQEVQIPFDSAGKIEVITEEMENHLHLFDKYPHFHEARLFRQNEDTYILEVSSLDDGKLSRDRVPKTKADVLALEKQFTDVATERSPSIFLDQSSRSKFLVWETLLGFFAYGPLFVASLNLSSSNNIGATTGMEFVAGGLGFIIPYVLTKNAPMNDAEASFALGGAFNGAIHGVMLDLLFTNGNNGNEIYALTALGSIAETGIGYAVARTYNFSEGKSDMIRYGGFFGSVNGALTSLVINPEHPSWSLAAGLSLAGSAAGYYASTILTNNEHYTRGNASAVLTAELYGMLLVPALYGSVVSQTFNDNNASVIGRGFALSGIVGNLGGLILGHALMRDRQFSTAEGNDVILGTTAGYLIGYGLAYIIAGNSRFENVSVWSFTLPITICTSAGFGIMLAVIGKGSGDEKSSGWNLNFNPGGLMGALLPQKHITTTMYTAPIAGLQYGW